MAKILATWIGDDALVVRLHLQRLLCSIPERCSAFQIIFEVRWGRSASCASNEGNDPYEMSEEMRTNFFSGVRTQFYCWTFRIFRGCRTFLVASGETKILISVFSKKQNRCSEPTRKFPHKAGFRKARFCSGFAFVSHARFGCSKRKSDRPKTEVFIFGRFSCENFRVDSLLNSIPLTTYDLRWIEYEDEVTSSYSSFLGLIWNNESKNGTEFLIVPSEG